MTTKKETAVPAPLAVPVAAPKTVTLTLNPQDVETMKKILEISKNGIPSESIKELANRLKSQL